MFQKFVPAVPRQGVNNKHNTIKAWEQFPFIYPKVSPNTHKEINSYPTPAIYEHLTAHIGCMSVCTVYPSLLKILANFSDKDKTKRFTNQSFAENRRSPYRHKDTKNIVLANTLAG